MRERERLNAAVREMVNTPVGDAIHKDGFERGKVVGRREEPNLWQAADAARRLLAGKSDDEAARPIIANLATALDESEQRMNSIVTKLHDASVPPKEKEGGGCVLAGPGRGDCEGEVGLPGQSVPGQHDGDDDTVDVYGKPNGWCWSCWKAYRLRHLELAVPDLVELVDVDTTLGIVWTGEEDKETTLELVKGAREKVDAMILAVKGAAPAGAVHASPLLEEAWVVISNAFGGDWASAPKKWRAAAKRWREQYHKTL